MNVQFRQFCQDIKCNHSQLEWLQSELSVCAKERSTEVDEGIHRDLVIIVEEKCPYITDMYHIASFQRVFWEQQQKPNSLKSTQGMRWNPLMIRQFLYLRHLSGSAYELRSEAGCYHTILTEDTGITLYKSMLKVL